MTKSEFVASQIESQIVNEIFKPGTQLPSEAFFCEQYGVSRMTVRSALTAIAAKGLIKTYKGKGSIVCEHIARTDNMAMEAANRTDLFEFRRILETEVAGIVAQRANQGEIAELRKLAILMKNTQDAVEVAVDDAQFHRLLAMCTRNRVIINIYDLLKDNFSMMFTDNVRVMGNKGSDDHLKIVAAIESRNAEQARTCMKEHLNRTMQRLNMSVYSDDVTQNESTPGHDAEDA